MRIQRILLSLGMIVFVGAVAAGATGAFFSDTETSIGNTFAAGDIDLQIDNESYAIDYNIPGFANPTGVLALSTTTSWLQQNLGQGCLTNASTSPCFFFHFVDLKPGDFGEDTISVHVGSNNAWACMAMDLTQTPDNGLVDPESDAGDVTDGPQAGELQNYLHFTFWHDDGDNVFEDNETAIPSLNNVLASTLQGQWHVLADASNTPALVGGSTNFIAKTWCFGTLTPTPVAPGAGTPLQRGTGFSCSGVGNQNDAQTDSIVLDVGFQAIQSRNNGLFLCSSLPPLN